MTRAAPGADRQVGGDGGAAGSDDLDRAASITQEMTDQAISDVRHAARPQQVQKADGSWPYPDCVDCGDELKPLRLQMGRIRCVECQTICERSANR